MDLVDMKQEREAEEQKFLQEIQRAIIDQEDHEEARLKFLAEMAMAIAAFLAKEAGEELPWFDLVGTEFIFKTGILPAISSFSKTNEERNALLSRLLEWCVSSFTYHFHAEFLSQMVQAPEKVLGEKAKRPD